MIGYKYYFTKINLVSRQEQKLEIGKTGGDCKNLGRGAVRNECLYKPPNIKHVDTLDRIKHL